MNYPGRILFLFFWCWTQTAFSQDAEYPPVIAYNGVEQIFPASWLAGKTKARATMADTAKFRQDTAAILEAFYKYPIGVLQKNIAHIYIVGKLSFNNQRFTGTNSSDDIFIGSEGNLEIEKTFHHEFSSILLRNYADFSLEMKWKELSPGIRNGNSASAVKAGFSSVNTDSVLLTKGYLSPYSLSNWENDFNMYAENLFTAGRAFWQMADKNPIVTAKLKLVVQFYHSVWSGYTWDYFRIQAMD